MDDESLLNDFLEAASIEPDDPLVLFGLASEYLKLHRYDDAIDTAKRLIAVQPDYSAAYKLLGQGYSGKGDNEAAIETYHKGIGIAEAKGDLQARKEMEVFLHRIQPAQ